MKGREGGKEILIAILTNHHKHSCCLNVRADFMSECFLDTLFKKLEIFKAPLRNTQLQIILIHIMDVSAFTVHKLINYGSY